MSRIAFLVVVCIVMVSCQEATVTYKDYASLWAVQQDPALGELLTQYHQHKKPHPVRTMEIDPAWTFQKGMHAEQLKTTLGRIIGEPITLPHRVLLPNTALWYEKTIVIPSSGVLTVEADDGAQVWLNDRPAARVVENYFTVQEPGTYRVTVRVLNNAMAGGLRSVGFIDQSEFNKYQDAQENYVTWKRTVEKAILLPGVSADEAKRLLLESDTTLSFMWKPRPHLVGPWLTKNGTVFTVRALAEPFHPVTLRWGTQQNSLSHEISAQGDVVSFTIPDEGKEIYYQLQSAQTSTPVYKIATSDSLAFSFSVWADSQSGWSTFQRHVSNLTGENDAFTLAAGDLVGNGSDAEEWRSLLGILSSFAATRPAYLVAGNHDYDGYYSDLMSINYHRLAAPSDKEFFSWTHGNCAFIAIDPNRQFPIGFSTEQREWFHQTIASKAWKNAQWRFVVLHQPPYSQGWAGYEGDSVVRHLLEPVIESAKIDFVISGHTHDYERYSRQYGNQLVTYLIVGGGGGSLEPPESSSTPEMDTVIKVHHMGRFRINGSSAQWEVRDVNNNLIDKKNITK